MSDNKKPERIELGNGAYLSLTRTPMGQPIWYDVMAADGTTLFRGNVGADRLEAHLAFGLSLSPPADSALVTEVDAETTKLLEQRDYAEDKADDLADAIAEITGEDIGEHSSCNDPWSKALSAAEDYINLLKIENTDQGVANEIANWLDIKLSPQGLYALTSRIATYRQQAVSQALAGARETVDANK